ncbi:MAG TPA: hypothetical protein VKV40_05335 [Ktedonobacteraceae bacterium]|nr:hypothetical protein [Ktedonobacteraceae bacterium]
MQQTGVIHKRPLGITIIAILLFISAVIEILGGITSIIGASSVGTISEVLLGWFPLILGIIELVLAWGLWTLKPWAYWGTLVAEIIIILVHFFGFLGLPRTHSALAVISGGIVSIIIVIYLLVDHNVRRAFQVR